ncbi:hypothetical protein JCM10207_000240 [Rhodosporidiobolus poonsookiae]
MLQQQSRLPSRLHLAFLAAVLFFLPPRCRAAIAASDLLSYVGGTGRGQVITTVAFQVTMVANDSAVVWSLSYDGAVSDAGWLGCGVGSAMTDSDIYVLWPTVDGSSVTWTLSHRTASTTAMPTLVGDAGSDVGTDGSGNLKVVASLSSSSADEKPAVVTFVRPLSMPDGYEGGANYQLEAAINQNFIYAYGDKNPGKSDQDADFEQHGLDMMGASYMDLSAEFTADTAAIDAPLTPVQGGSTSGSGGSSASKTSAASSSGGDTGGASSTGSAGATDTATASSSGTTGGSSSSTGSSSSSSSAASASSSKFSYSTVIVIHGICAGTAWAFFAPFGVLFARYGRGPPGTTLFRFPWHFGMQGWIVTPLTIAALFLALWAVRLKTSSSSETYAHQIIGFCFIIALAVQDLLGVWKHSQPHIPGQPRSLVGWLHIFLGVALIAVGFYQVKLGMDRYGSVDTVITWAYYG